MKNLRKIAAKFLPSARAITEIHSLCQFNLKGRDIARTKANRDVVEHCVWRFRQGDLLRGLIDHFLECIEEHIFSVLRIGNIGALGTPKTLCNLQFRGRRG
jgi:hypothetical protein